METEKIGEGHTLVTYQTADGRTRYAIVSDEGDGYGTPALASGCHTYRCADIDRVVRYAAAHGVTYASRAGALRAYRRDYR